MCVTVYETYMEKNSENNNGRICNDYFFGKRLQKKNDDSSFNIPLLSLKKSKRRSNLYVKKITS